MFAVQPLSDDKHRKTQDTSEKHTGNPRQNSVWEIFFQWSEKHIFWTEFCLGQNFVSDWIWLELNFVSDWICLGLNFFSDYIQQLYFKYNHLIYIIVDIDIRFCMWCFYLFVNKRNSSYYLVNSHFTLFKDVLKCSLWKELDIIFQRKCTLTSAFIWNVTIGDQSVNFPINHQ